MRPAFAEAISALLEQRPFSKHKVWEGGAYHPGDRMTQGICGNQRMRLEMSGEHFSIHGSSTLHDYFPWPFRCEVAPFSPMRFIGFLAGLAVVSLYGDRQPAQLVPVALVPTSAVPAVGLASTSAAGSMAGNGEATIVRCAMPGEDVYEDLHQIDPLWFLRRLDASGSVGDRDAGTLAVALSYQGRPVSPFFERLVALDEDRSKLFVRSVPEDGGLVGRLAGSLKTKLAPPS